MGPTYSNVCLGIFEVHSEDSMSSSNYRHGRDNKLHVWKTLVDSAARVREAASQPDLPTPELEYSMDVNALNYCRFSLLPISGSSDFGEDAHALIAVPNLVESSLVCSLYSAV